MILSFTLATVLLVLAPQQSPSPRSLCDQALEFYRTKDYAAAVKAASQAVQQDVRDAACQHIYGLSLAAVARYSEAEQHLNQAISLKPTVGNYHYDLGFVLYQQKKYEASVPVLKRAVELDGENLMARFLLGRTYVSAHRSLLLGNFSKLALEQLSYVARKDPRFPTLHYHIGLIYSNDGAIEKAIQELKLEIQYQPSNAQARVALAELQLKKGELQAAMEQLQLAEKTAPSVSLVHYTLAKAYREQGRLDKAIEAAEKSVRLDATSADAHYLLGQLYRENGQAEQAQHELELFKKYQIVNP
jgi:tetratricopeptide (TPR) repeat protein